MGAARRLARGALFVLAVACLLGFFSFRAGSTLTARNVQGELKTRATSDLEIGGLGSPWFESHKEVVDGVTVAEEAGLRWASWCWLLLAVGVSAAVTAERIGRVAPTTRRPLTFGSLAEAVQDAETLLRSGYTANGKWSLSQACDHLADWLGYSVDGFPPTPVLLRPVMWLMRVTIGRREKAKLLAGKPFPTGGPTLPQSVHPPGEDAAAVERYRNAVERFEKYTGPVHPSPLFGPLTKDEVRTLHVSHAAHHLSFLTPKRG